ncbi:unnamed protein product [Adineta steineri]|uniref:Uncharacterized protein n=1 Tax=Adineta steineri TaxID=433720 RepID=A0A818RZW7_9BILA|nr:unnamed protein product [Adineta steineri]CAF1289603.1 unnamed protein product [Adineta steineri]CAF1294583.1 unnamed protein product [Adineta steineri]CAF3664594.1 unnamed protein product [Adineta steineri]CAF3977046.1 unnamed protein product [Adineta steineri]
MQLTTILAVFFTCLVLFASVDYTNGIGIKGKHSINRPDTVVKAKARHENTLKSGGRRQSAARAIVESIKQRRKHAN